MRALGVRFDIWKQRRKGLDRFVEAQDRPALRSMTVYDQAAYELHLGCKQTHWMWFVFPQRPGLGQSTMSRIYALGDREAVAYLKHPVLGRRLRACTAQVTEWLLAGRPIEDIFGPVDAAKFASCMELFRDVERNRRYYRSDEATGPTGQFEFAQLAIRERRS